MNILEYADVINTNIVITYCHNQDMRFSAYFESCEVKEGAALLSEYGDGTTPEAAIREYVTKIRGRRIIFHATRAAMRREFDVPKGLTGFPEGEMHWGGCTCAACKEARS